MQLWLCKRTYNERNNNSSKMRIGGIVDVEVVWCVPHCKEVEKVSVCPLEGVVKIVGVCPLEGEVEEVSVYCVPLK